MPFQVKQTGAIEPLPPVAADSQQKTTANTSPGLLQSQSTPDGQSAERLPAPPPVPPPVARSALTLDQLESMAMANNPTLVQASARVGSLRGAWLQAGLYPNPRVAYKGDEMGDSNTAGFQGTSVAQEIVTKHKLARAQDVISQQVNQAIQEYTAQEFRVRNDVKLRFYEVLLAQRAVEINQQMERLSRATAEAADDLFRANQVARSDVLQARVEADTVQLQSVRARNAYQSAWRRLAVIIGVPAMEPATLAGDLREGMTDTTWDDAWNRLVSASPELSAAQARASAACAAISKAVADRCPNLDVEIGYAHDNSTGFDTAAAFVTIPVPIFNRNQGAIRQAQQDLTAAQAEADRMALELRNRLALVFERYSNAKEMVDRYERSILPNARESADLTSARYRAGDVNYTGVLVVQRTLLQTQIAYLDSLRELRETSVLLDGLLLSDSLPARGP